MLRLGQVLAAAMRVLHARIFDQYRWHDEVIVQCERLGGVYIKFIQMLAVHETTKHWVGGITADMAYEQVPYEPIDIALELGANSRHFASISSEPIAAGSYGQVYSATLLSGEAAIIKILRPSVRKTLKQDLRILNFVAVMLGRFSRASIVDVKAIAQEFSRMTYAETDYKREAESGEWLRSYFDKRQTLVIPRSYRELGARHVLVQQYVPGISLATAMSRQREGERIDQLVYDTVGSNVWSQLDILGTEFLNAIMYADYQMVDPHPGNIRLLSDNKVALIDFGMMSTAPRNREAFVNMLGEFVKVYENRFEPGSFAAAMLAFFDMELHDALQIIARQQSSDYMESLERFVRQFMAGQTGSLTQHYVLDRQMARLFNQVINRNNKLGIRISKENVMLQRSMSMFLSVMRGIGENHDGQVHFTVLHGIMSRAYQGALQHGFKQSAMPLMSEGRAYEVAANWLTLIAENDRELYGFIMKRRYA